jgi:hypothetical protein
MTDLRETLKNKTKFDFFAMMAQLINFSPIDIIEGEEKITILGDNGKLKILYKEKQKLVDYDKWVDEFGEPLMKDFNNNKININSQYNIETNG